MRQAGIATRRCFVVETMGGQCGYLALLGGLSGGAVRVYLHEEGITLQELAHDVERMVESFRVGQRLFLAVMNEEASPMYNWRLPVPAVQPGGAGAVRRPRWSRPDPAGRRAVPFDRILGTRPRTRSTGSATRSRAPAPAGR